MAEDSTVETPEAGGGEESLEELRQTLTEKQEELAGLRAERERLQREAAERVESEQVKAAIAEVERQINFERDAVEVQRGMDAKHVGTGEFSDPQDAPPPAVDPDNPEMHTVAFGEVAQPVEPDLAADQNEAGENDENNEGSDR